VDLKNSFEVPLPPEQAWAVLLDIPRIAPCMPGAELTEVVDDRTYKGKVAVRLGPVALAFAGTAKFDEIDAATHSAKVSAQGADSRGRGGANAQVRFRLEPVPAGSKVLVDTNVNLSGSVAQYGRGTGVIQSVAAQLISQFARNLEEELKRVPVTAVAGGAPAGVATAPGQDAPQASAPASRPAAAKPISGFSLLWAALLDWLRGLFGGRKAP